jgi:hypothetical protein
LSIKGTWSSRMLQVHMDEGMNCWKGKKATLLYPRKESCLSNEINLLQVSKRKNFWFMVGCVCQPIQTSSWRIVPNGCPMLPRTASVPHLPNSFDIDHSLRALSFTKVLNLEKMYKIGPRKSISRSTIKCEKGGT